MSISAFLVTTLITSTYVLPSLVFSCRPQNDLEDSALGADNGHNCDVHEEALSLLQKRAQIVRNTNTPGSFHELTEDPFVEESCGKTSPLQRTPEHALPIPPVLKGGYKLMQVQAVIRHGAPYEMTGKQCPNLAGVTWNCSVLPPQEEAFAKAFNVESGNCQLGQLLDWGSEQQARNGKALRAAYVTSGLLGKCPRVYSYADDGAALLLVRTAQSKVALLSSMFKDDEYAHIEQTSDFDIYYTSNTYCCEQWTTPPTWAMPPDALQESHALWNKFVGDSYPQMLCQVQGVCNQAGTPVGIEAYTSAVNKSFAALQQFYKSENTINEQKTTQASLIVSELLLNMLVRLDSIGSKDAPQFVLWSSHDTVVYPIALSLGYETPTLPPYAAVLLLEVWRNEVTGEDGVRVVYQGQDVTLQLPACIDSATPEGLCPLQSIRDLIQTQVHAARKVGLDLREPPPLDFGNQQCKSDAEAQLPRKGLDKNSGERAPSQKSAAKSFSTQSSSALLAVLLAAASNFMC